MDSDSEKMKCIANRILALCKKLRIGGLKKLIATLSDHRVKESILTLGNKDSERRRYNFVNRVICELSGIVCILIWQTKNGILFIKGCHFTLRVLFRYERYLLQILLQNAGRPPGEIPAGLYGSKPRVSFDSALLRTADDILKRRGTIKCPTPFSQ